MNQQQVKSILLEIENTELEFSLIFSGKASKKVNGLYKPSTHEIILHNRNFKTDNQLMYTAIHEYAHHLITEEQENSAIAVKPTRVHNNEFWARFHGLLEIAEKKGFYAICVNASPELLAMTEKIKKNYLEKIGILKKELGEHLSQAYDLCTESNVRYEDYLDRCLQISKKEARSARNMNALGLSPSLGYENMQMIAAIPSPEKRAEAQQQFSSGKSSYSVRSAMKKETEDVDDTIVLEKEKTRLEKTITKLSNRLEQVKDIIINGFKSIKESQPVMNDEISPSGDKGSVLSISKDKGDFEVVPFKGSGKGGQKRKKTMSACRIIHKASGVVSECQEERSFFQNRKIAFKRLCEKPIFKNWLRIEVAKTSYDEKEIDAKVEKEMQNIVVEFKNNDKWVKEAAHE